MVAEREVHLLLVDDAARPLGLLGPVAAGTPWWPDVEPVVRTVRERWDLDVQVLRVLSASSRPADEPGGAAGGVVTYLAQCGQATSVPLRPVPDDVVEAALADEPLRAPWAHVGGPGRIASWADAVLTARGTPRTGPVEQVKTWNLSSILRVPTDAGPVWCKSVPTFFAHEPAVIELLAARGHADLVPQVLGRDAATGSMLLADLPGSDQWAAPLERLVQMVQAVVDLQHDSTAWLGDLRATGLPDWRGPALVAALTTLCRRPDVREPLTDVERSALDGLVDALPVVDHTLAACGLPDTLVHGDLHPGNWRYGSRGLVLLDWGDSGVGHPLLDGPAFLERVPAEHRSTVLAAWAERWQHHVPDADVERAVRVVEPLAALRQALIYQGFLDRIEPDEHVYHRADVPHWIRTALDLSQTIGL